MPELALDHVERDAFTSHLDRVRVAELVGREATPHACLGREAAELDPHMRYVKLALQTAVFWAT